MIQNARTASAELAHAHLLPHIGKLHYSCAIPMRNARPGLTLLFATLLASGNGAAAQRSVEPAPFVFAGSTDIGTTLKGSTVSGLHPGTLQITGGGADMWGTKDDFHLDWVQLFGDATLTADVHFAPGAAALAKGVLIFRQNLRPTSAYADVALHGDGHVTLQFRPTEGAPTRDITASEHGATRIRIERKGDVFTASTESADGKFTAFASQTVALKGPVYVGLGVCSHNAKGLVTVNFANATCSTQRSCFPSHTKENRLKF